MIRAMKRAGCVRICYGLESADPDLLRKTNKLLAQQGGGARPAVRQPAGGPPRVRSPAQQPAYTSLPLNGSVKTFGQAGFRAKIFKAYANRPSRV